MYTRTRRSVSTCRNALTALTVCLCRSLVGSRFDFDSLDSTTEPRKLKQDEERPDRGNNNEAMRGRAHEADEHIDKRPLLDGTYMDQVAT